MQAFNGFLERHATAILGKKLPALSIPNLFAREAAEEKRVELPIAYFMEGYQLSHEFEPEQFASKMSTEPLMKKKVNYEGAYAGYAAKDLTNNGKLDQSLKLLPLFPESEPSLYMSIGMALSLLDSPIDLTAEEIENNWGWLAMDGYGFGESYFRWTQNQKRTAPDGLSATGLQAYDEGKGRAIWFITKTDPKLISESCEAYSESRRASLWTGVGLMAGAWGSNNKKDIQNLIKASKNYLPNLQLGVAFGAFIATISQGLEHQQEETCQLICQRASQEIVPTVLAHYQRIGPNNVQGFLEWRQNIIQMFL